MPVSCSGLEQARALVFGDVEQVRAISREPFEQRGGGGDLIGRNGVSRDRLGGSVLRERSFRHSL
jgi:hypothetical protein